MADDQATLGSFADGADAADGAGDDDGTASSGDSEDDSETRSGGSSPLDDEDVAPGGADARVCPWCLAGADRFVETGPTGLACDRCSGALPVGMDWFDAREAVARRPMYETDD